MLPCIVCHLTDKNGNILNPLLAGSITYIEQKTSKQQVPVKMNSNPNNSQNINMLSVCIQGYITIFVDGKKFSPPIFFCIIRNLIPPKNSSMYFITTDFHCHAIPTFCSNKQTIRKFEVFVEVSFSTLCCKSTLFKLPSTELASSTMKPTLIYAEKMFDSISFKGDTIVTYDRLFHAEVCYYIALSNGKKNEYTNKDSLPEYHGSGIFSPKNVSYYNLFVNGMLQPKSNYTIRDGLLEFNTNDIPAENVSIVIEFITIKDTDGEILPAEVDYYVTLSNGSKRIFNDVDALPIYSNKGILAPKDVSCFNFYINGVLQPKINYTIKKGQLELISEDLPPDSTILILESILLKTNSSKLFQAELEQYNALSNSGKTYTDNDELKMYGNFGIPDPKNASYQNLLVNSVLQPPINYSVQKGSISLQTEDTPLVNAPLTLQSVSFLEP